MVAKYVNTGFVPGSSDYTDVQDPAHPATASFQAKSSTVKVGTASQRMSSVTLTLVSPFGIVDSCSDCEVGQLNATGKLQLNFPYGDTVTADRIVDEITRLLAIWKANNMVFGVVPPINVDIDPL